jgi:hypothetical protein
MISYFFWMSPRLFNFRYRRFGTLRLFHLHRRWSMKKNLLPAFTTYFWVLMLWDQQALVSTISVERRKSCGFLCITGSAGTEQSFCDWRLQPRSGWELRSVNGQDWPQNRI